MANLKEYTTREKIEKIKDEKEKEKEVKKIIVSSDAYAVCDLIQQLNNKLEQVRISALIK